MVTPISDLKARGNVANYARKAKKKPDSAPASCLNKVFEGDSPAIEIDADTGPLADVFSE
jgi:hypothetical protein